MSNPNKTVPTSGRKRTDPLDLSHPLFNRSERRLREIVDVCMGSHDGMPLLNVLLSRVPTIGEDVAHGARIFRVINVQHAALDLDGRADFGSHAYLTVVEVPDVGWLMRPENPAVRNARRKRPRGKSRRARRPGSANPQAPAVVCS